ncbi:hypothetical protein ERJ75_001484900 [Trypanosoma vivax]|nr:hypothetical protein ERJ75_001484900 [Trypanosoma vivax]
MSNSRKHLEHPLERQQQRHVAAHPQNKTRPPREADRVWHSRHTHPQVHARQWHSSSLIANLERNHLVLRVPSNRSHARVLAARSEGTSSSPPPCPQRSRTWAHTNRASPALLQQGPHLQCLREVRSCKKVVNDESLNFAQMTSEAAKLRQSSAVPLAARTSFMIWWPVPSSALISHSATEAPSQL